MCKQNNLFFLHNVSIPPYEKFSKCKKNNDFSYKMKIGENLPFVPPPI